MGSVKYFLNLLWSPFCPFIPIQENQGASKNWLSLLKTTNGMMAIKGIYAEYGVKRLNHGVGFNTAAIELLLPTYAEKLGLKGKIAV